MGPIMRFPWDRDGGLTTEPADRSGLSRFLADHRACAGGIDVSPRAGADGSMIRVTCTQCGRAVEALASSWEGWWEEQMPDVPPPSRRFEPGRERHVRRHRPTPPPRVEFAREPGWRPGWRAILLGILVIAWSAAGLLLVGSAITR
jgi:hypothetical protein